ncbi:MAG: tetratricopeptide repeat protein [Rhodospirillales bacterium]|nr:tetratricopeptide repeat protein [Rhodospirillales bacterium]
MAALKQIEPNLNAYTFSFDGKILDRMRSMYSAHVAPFLSAPKQATLFEAGYTKSGQFHSAAFDYFYTSYGKNPLLWVSCDGQSSFDPFQEAFENLDITEALKGLVDFDDHIQLYCGFFVVGNQASQETFHVDYRPGANAYTLLTPLFPTQPEHGNLQFKDEQNVKQTYVYKTGEAILVGDHFEHGTEPYAKTPVPRVLFCLQIGTDKIEHWSVLEQTIASQSNFLVLPCGHVRGRCQCLDALATNNPHQISSGTQQVTTATAMEIAARFYQTGDVSKAGDICRQVLNLEPVHPIALQMLGRIALAKTDFSAAVDLITRSFVADPENKDAYGDLGQAYRALGQNDRAESCFKKAAALVEK